MIKRFDTKFELDEHQARKAEKKLLDEYFGESNWANKGDEDNG